MNKVAIMTLGCKTNQYESEALMDIFYKNRYEIVDFDDFSDIYIINTCTVTHVSDKKSRQMIRRAKKNNPESIVIVMGCYAQISPDEVSQIEGVDIIIGTNARHQILSYIDAYRQNLTSKPYVIIEDIMKVQQFEDMKLEHITTHTRAFIKIQEGCNQFCSYCIIPYARGLVRSRPVDSILDEITKLSKSGYSEFVLTGIHIGSYGVDLQNVSLIDLLEKIDQISTVKRIRIGSIEPRIITDDFIRRLDVLTKICDHFHLSLQSGSDSVLKRMNRKYTSEEYQHAVEKLRSIYANPAITTDIIVGFPGETEAEYLETLNFVKKIQFSEVHVFPFSIREGTPAATMENQVSPQIKKQRSEQLIELVTKQNRTYNESFLNQYVDVLFEETQDAYQIGHTPNYLKVYVELSNEQENDIRVIRQNDIYRVKIVKIENNKIFGQFM